MRMITTSKNPNATFLNGSTSDVNQEKSLKVGSPKTTASNSLSSTLLPTTENGFFVKGINPLRALQKFYSFKKIIICLLLLLPLLSKAQPFNTGTITLDGDALEAAYVTSGNYSMAWDDTYLYLRVNSGSANEPVILHLDFDPQNPVDGGTNANGSLTGANNYGITPTLPFRSDFQVYWEGSYAEYRSDNGSGGWSGITTIATPGDRSNGSTNREIRLSWVGMMGLGGRPTAFNWLGFSNSTGSFIFNQVPAENPSGGGNPQSPTLNYYHTVSSTANNASITQPFSQKSFESRANLTLGTANTFWDFTVNGGTLTNTNNHTINNQLYAVSGTLTQTGARTLTFGSSSTHTPSLRCDGTINPNNGGGNDMICTFAQGTTTLSGTATDANFRLFDVNVSSGATLQGPSTGTVTLGLQFGTMTATGTGIVNFRNGTGVVNTNIVNNGTNNYNFSNTAGTVTFNNLTTSASATFRPITSGTHNINIGGNLVNTTGTYSTSNTGILHTRFNGTAAQAISVAQTFQNLTISNTAANVTASGDATIASTRVLTIDANARLDMGTNLLTITGATSSINGFLRTARQTNPPITGASTTTLTINNGGFVEMNQTCTGTALGTTCVIPTATWNAGSTVAIIGLTSPTAGGWLGGAGQTFSNFTWNTSSLTTNPNMGGVTLTSTGTFTLTTTNGSELRMGSASSGTITCGNFTQTNGILNMAAGSGTGTLNCSGTFNQSGGTITESSTGIGIININASSGSQNITQSGTISNTVNWNIGTGVSTNTGVLLTGITTAGTMTVLNNASLNFGAQIVSGTGTFVAATGSTLISANTNATGAIMAAGANGSVQTTTRTFTNNGVNYTFNGTAAQFTGTSIAAATNIGTLNLSNTSGSNPAITFTTSPNVAAALNVNNGINQLGSNNITITPTTAASVSGGSSTAFIQTNSTGRLIRAIATAGLPITYAFPVGTSTNYTPASFAFTANNTARNLIVGAVGAVHPDNGSPAHFINNRYWVTNLSVTTGTYTYSSVFTYLAGDVSGTIGSIRLSRWGGSLPWIQDNTSSASGTTLSSTTGLTEITGNLATTAEWAGRVNAAPVSYTWVGFTDGVWGTSTNWSPTGVPATIDNVTLANGSTGALANLNLTTAVTVADITFAGTGSFFTVSSVGSITATGDVTYTSGSGAWDCASTFTMSSSSAQTIPSMNFGNLVASGGNRTISGTTGICGLFTRGAGAYTVTGSTVNYNGTGAQTLSVGTYNNLTISNARGSANLTSPAGTISVDGTFDISGLSAYTPVVNAASIFDFTNAGAQTIPAFFYGQLNNTGNGARTLANSGIVDIAQGFTPSSGTTTMTGSTVRYSNTSATTWNLSVFTTNFTSPVRQYNNLIFNGGASTIWSQNGITMGGAADLTVTSGMLQVGSSGGAGILNVDGNISIDGANGTLNLSSSTGGNTGTINLLGNFSQSNGLFNKSGSAAGTFNFAKTSLTQTLSQSGGTITNNGTTWNLGTGATSNTIQLASNFVVGAGSLVANNTATVDFQTFILSGTTDFTANTGTNLLTANTNSTGAIMASGANGSIQSTGTRTFTNTGVNYTFNGTAAQFTGSAIATATNIGTLNLSNTSGSNPAVTFTSSPTVATALNVNNGINQLGTNNITISATTAASVTGGSSTAFLQTNSTGRLIRAIATAGLPIGYSFPIGTSTNYTPASFNFTANAAAMNLIVGAVGSRNSNDVTATDYINNRYWVTNLSGSPSTYTYTSVFTFLTSPTDVVGTIGNIRLNRFGGITWTEDASSSASGNTLSSSSLTQATGSLSATAEWAGRVNPPFSTYTWDGSTDGDWNTAANWDLVAVPSSSSDVIIIPDAGSYTTALAITGTRAVADFTVNANGTYSMSAASQLTIGGNYTYSSSTAATFNCSSTLILSSSTAQTLPVADYGILNLAGGARTLANGTIGICGNYTAGSSTTVGTSIVAFNGTAAQAINTNAASFATLNITNTAADVTANISLTTSTAMTINSSAVLNQASGTLTLTGSTVSVNGTLRNSTANDIVGGTITFTSTGTYDHNRNSGAVPSATWNAGSNCLISGTTTSEPSGLGQSFSDFTFNSPISASRNLSGALTTVGRDLNISGTNGFTLGLTASTALALTVGRDINVSNSFLTVVTTTASPTVAVTRDVNIGTGGGLTLANSASTTGTASMTVTGAVNINSAIGTSLVVGASASKVSTLTVTGLITKLNSGTVSIGQGTAVSTLVANGGFTVTAGTVNVSNGGSGGVLTLGSSSVLTINGGTLVGSATAHTSTINANGNVAVSSGILTLANNATGTSTMNLADNRNMIVSGTGTVNIAPTGTGTLNISTNTPSAIATTGYLEVNGGTLNVASGGTGVLNLYQNLLLTSGTFARTAGGATVNFRAVGTSVTTPHPQTITQGTCIPTGTIAYNVGLTGPFSLSRIILGSNVDLGTGSTIVSFSGSYLDFGTNFLSGLNFTANNGTNLITANADGLNTIATGAIGSLRTTNTRNLTATSIQYVFNGTVAQVTGTAVGTALYFSINNPTTVTLSTNLTIVSTGSVFVNFSGLQGKLQLANFNLTFSSPGPPTFGSDVVGANTTYYIVTNGTGRMISPVSTTAKVFPVGNSAFNPITLTPGVGSNIPYQVRVIDAVTSPSPNDGTKLINRYWSVTAPTAAANTLTLNSTWNSGEDNANYAAGSQVKVAYHNGTSWTEINSTQVGGGPFTSSGAFALSAANINSGITFGIGKDDGFIGTFTWNGSASSSWTNQNNWTPVTAVGGPLATDNVIINVPGTNTLDITGTISINDFALSGTGLFNMSAASSLTINGNFTNSSSAASTFNCSSTLNIANAGSQPIPAFNYGNLNATGGNRVLANTGTIGICGTFTQGAGTYTSTGSTVNFNGVGAQTINALNFNNLTISNSRSAATLTLAAGTTNVAGTFDISTLSNYTPSVTGNTFNFSGAAGQVIAAFQYNNITNANNARTLSSTGTVSIAGSFTPGSGVYTTTGSTVQFNGDVNQTIPVLTSANYNNVIINATSTTFTKSITATQTFSGNLTINGGTFVQNTNTTFTLTITGNLTINLGTYQQSSTGGNTTLNITGNLNQNGGLFLQTASTSYINIQTNLTGDFNQTAGQWNFNNNASVSAVTGFFTIFGNYTATGGTIVTTGGAITLKGSLTMNNTLPRTYSRAGGGNLYVIFVKTGTGTLTLNSNLTVQDGRFAIAANSIVNAGLFTITSNNTDGNNTAENFTINSTGTFITSHVGGIAGAVTLSGSPLPTWAISTGSYLSYTGTAQSTGLTGTGATTIDRLNWLGTTSLTLDAALTVTSQFNFTNNGLFILGNNTLSLSSTNVLNGGPFSVTKMFVTNGTGSLSRSVLSSGTGLPFTWPIGENTGTTEYSPVTVTSIANAGINGTIAYRVVDGIQPNIAPALSYLSRYWPCSITGYNSTYSLSGLTFTYDPLDIVVGPENLLKGNIYNSTGAYWTELATSSAASNVLTIASGISGSFMPTPGTYDITGRIDVPTYYRTVATGNWTSLATWETADNISFTGAVPATTAPTNFNSVGIFIRNTHTVTVNTSLSGDDVTIFSGGTLQITANTFTLANGTAGNDMLVNSGGTLLCASATNNSMIIASSAVLGVNGLFIQAGAGAPDLSNSGTINIGNGATYEHARNAGIVPTCSWFPGSTCLLSGITSNAPTGLGQIFHHFTVNTTLTSSVNCSGALQTINGNLNVTTNHASFGFRLSTGTAYTLVVGGNLIINDGLLDPASGGSGPCVVTVTGSTTMNGANSRIDKTGAAAVTMNFNGDYTQNAGTFDFNSGGSSNTTVNFRGNVLWNGSVLRTNGGTHNINFDKTTGLQTLTCGATFGAGAVSWNVGNSTTNTVRLLSNVALNNSLQNFTVNNGATFDCGAFVLTGGNTSFVLSATGGLKSGNANGIYTAPTALGSIQTLNRTYIGSASYFYNGTINQVTGNGLPNTLITTGNINIENTGTSGNNTVTLTNNNTTTPTFNLISGLFAADTPQQLNITTGGTVNATGGDFATGATAGLLNFPGTGTFSGSCSPYNVHIAGGVNFGAGTVTIQNAGRLRILAGGSVNTNAPAYAVGSSLEYNTGGNYDRGTEWTTASGKGYPHHVTINTSTLNPARTGGSFAATTFNTGGNVNITSGGNIYMDFGGNNMTVPLIVNGDLTLVGQLSGSGSAGGDVRLRGNWINNGVATSNYFPNARAVFFDGTLAQTIGGSNTTVIPFAFLTINNASGVTLTTYNVEINNQLTLTSGNVTLGNFNLKLNGLNTPITGASSTRYLITNGTGNLIRNFNNISTLFPVGYNSTVYSPVTMQQTGTVDDISVRVDVAPAFSPLVNDQNQMVNLQWTINETTGGGNNISTLFQWPASSESVIAPGFIRTNGVFQGFHNGTNWTVRASTIGGSDPYTSSSATNFTGTLSNSQFVVGNINGILGCFQTAAVGDWNTGSTWSGGLVPPIDATVCVGHNITVISTPLNPSGITFNAGGDVTISNGTTLTLEPNGFINNSSGSVKNLTTGTIAFSGAGIVSGANSINFNRLQLNGATTLTTIPTINTELELLPGSNITATNSPVYAPTATLKYNIGAGYNRSNEWNTTSGAGFPANILVIGNTILNLNTGTLVSRSIQGNLQIDAGSTVTQVASAFGLVVPGNLTIDGTYTQSSVVGGDLTLGGNWFRGVTGVYTTNSRSVTFNGAANQSITRTGAAETFAYLVASKTAGNIVLSATDVIVNGNGGNVLQIGSGNTIDLASSTMTISGTSGNINLPAGASSVTGAAGSVFAITNGTKTVTPAGGATLSFGANVLVALSNGINFGANTSTINGTLQIALGGFVSTNAPFYATNSTLRYFSGSAYARSTEWSATSGAGYPFNVTIDPNGTNTTLNMGSGAANQAIAGNLTINTGAVAPGAGLNMQAMTGFVEVAGNVNINNAGALTLSSAIGGDIKVGGNFTRNTGGTLTQNNREVEMNGTALQTINGVNAFAYLAINNTLSTVQISANTTVSNRLRLSNGTFDLNSFTVTISNGSEIYRTASTAMMNALPTLTAGEVYDVRYAGTLTTGNEFSSDNTFVRDLILESGALPTLGANRTVNRNVRLAGDLNLGTFTLTHRGRNAILGIAGSIEITSGNRTITGSVGSIYDVIGIGANNPVEFTKQVTNPGSGTLTVGANVLMRIGDGRMDFGTGNPTTINGTLQVALGGSVNPFACYYGVGSTLRFANTVDYQVPAADITWASGAIASGLPGIPWNVEINDGGTDLQLQDTRALRNNLSITDGTFTLTAAFTGSFNIGGNWTRTNVLANSAFTHNNKKVTFDRQSAGNQAITVIGTIGNPLASETFYDLEVSTLSGNLQLGASSNTNVLNILNFVNGRFNINGTNNLVIGNSSSNGTITGFATTRYVISNGGNLRRFTNTNATYDFPLGDNVTYSPAVLVLTAGGQANAFIDSKVVNGIHPNMTAPVPTRYIARYWSIEPTGLTSSPVYDINYTYSLADEVGVGTMYPVKYSTATPTPGWQSSPGSSANAITGTSGMDDNILKTFSWSGLTTFSDFSGAGNGSPLPVELLSFDAVPVNNAEVLVTWITASEINNDKFIVERSADAEHFEIVGTVKGANNSNTMRNYSLTDVKPYNGVSYYRLRQVDFNGDQETFTPVAVYLTGAVGSSINVYPNPAIETTTLSINGQFKGKALLQIIDISGRSITREQINLAEGSNSIKLDVAHLANGKYLVNVTLADGTRMNMPLIISK